MEKLHWFWCWLCFKAFLALPTCRTHQSVYGRFTLWLLPYAGYYAYSPRHGRAALTEETGGGE
jgi:hypothetical protein